MREQQQRSYYRRCARKIPQDREGLPVAKHITALALCWVGILTALVVVVLYIATSIIDGYPG